MPKDSSHARRVVMLVDDGSNPFEMGVVTELFGLRRPELGREWYDFRLASATPEVAMHQGMFTLSGVSPLAAADSADILIVPNRPDPDVPARPQVLAAVARAAERGTRVVSFCTGAFTLAAAGVLDGRRATTHWAWTEAFAARFPLVRLEPDSLFVEDGPVLTAAGSSAALDLCLYLIRQEHGVEVANSVSRRLVYSGNREGGQRQFIPRPVPELPEASLSPVLEWARERLAEPLTVADLARRAATSMATLHRRFRAELGTTPASWLVAERVALACRLIEAGEGRLEVVARSSGLGTSTTLRAQMLRHTGISPSGYRRRFA